MNVIRTRRRCGTSSLQAGLQSYYNAGCYHPVEKLRLPASSAAQMPHRHNRMIQQHPRPAVAHHPRYPPAVVGLVAMHRAVHAGRLALPELTPRQPQHGIVKQFAALRAQAVTAVMPVPSVFVAAIDFYHPPHRALFMFYPRHLVLLIAQNSNIFCCPQSPVRTTYQSPVRKRRGCHISADKTYWHPEAGRRGAQSATRGERIYYCTPYFEVHPKGHPCRISPPLAALWASRLPASGCQYHFSQPYLYTGFTPCALLYRPFGASL